MAKDVLKLGSAKTVEGDSITIQTAGNGVMINNAHVVKADIAASNAGREFEKRERACVTNFAWLRVCVASSTHSGGGAETGRQSGRLKKECRNMMAWALGLFAVVAFALASGPASELVSGELLPALRGEFLTGREAVLPQAADRRVALLLLGFTYEARFPVEAWASRFREQFQSDPRVTFFEIPMIAGLAKLAKWFIDSGMRRGTPREDYEHVITVYREVDVWKQRVHYADPNAAYLILLDGTGKVVWRHAGGFDDQAYAALSSHVSAFLIGE